MRIAVCGSMSFAAKMLELGGKLEQAGHEVVLPKLVEEHSNGGLEEDDAEALRRKVEHDLIRDYFNEIRKCDALLVVNCDRKGVAGYVGGNSFLEMGFAHVLGKKVFLLNAVPEMPYSVEMRAMRPVVINGDLDKIV